MPSLPEISGLGGAVMNIAVGMLSLYIINFVTNFGRQITGGVGGIIGLFWDWFYWASFFFVAGMGYFSLPSIVTSGVAQLGGLKATPQSPPGA